MSTPLTMLMIVLLILAIEVGLSLLTAFELPHGQ